MLSKIRNICKYTFFLLPLQHELYNVVSYPNYFFAMKVGITLIVAIVYSMQMVAANLVVQTNNNAQQLHDVALIGKWVFEGDELQLFDKAGYLLASEQIAHIRKITFSTSSPSAIEDAEKNGILVYPNPTQDVLFVEGAEAFPLRVYDMQGRLLKEGNGNHVQVSELSSGTYLLQIGTQIVRFIKR